MTELIVMRLADMHRVHPDQIEGRCSRCNHVVAIYPSGQEVLRTYTDVKLICQVCKTPGGRAKLAPGAEHEPAQSRRKPPHDLFDRLVDLFPERHQAKARAVLGAGLLVYIAGGLLAVGIVAWRHP